MAQLTGEDGGACQKIKTPLSVIQLGVFSECFLVIQLHLRHNNNNNQINTLL